MDKATVATLVAYNVCHRILAACARISADEYIRPVAPDPGWGSLRGMLVHTLDTEYSWRSILLAREEPVLTAADLPDCLPSERAWTPSRSPGRSTWLGWTRSTSARATAPIPATAPRSAVMHVVNHGTHHRSEAAAILTGYGQSPGELDFDEFLKKCPDHR